jgi:hypothetical protein
MWCLLGNANRLKGLNCDNPKMYTGLNYDNPKIFAELNSILPLKPRLIQIVDKMIVIRLNIYTFAELPPHKKLLATPLPTNN